MKFKKFSVLISVLLAVCILSLNIVTVYGADILVNDNSEFKIEEMTSQIRFNKKSDGSYAEIFDVRARAKITDEDFSEYIGENREEARKNITALGFVFSSTSVDFSTETAKKVVGGEFAEGYKQVPVGYMQDLDGYYMFTCCVTDIPLADKNQGFYSYAYICIQKEDGVENWYFMDARVETDFNSLHTKYLPLACKRYDWETLGEAKYVWTKDYLTCEASRKCTFCGEIITEAVNSIFNETENMYVATFKDSRFEIQIFRLPELVYDGSKDDYDKSGYFVTPTGLSKYVSIYTHSSHIPVKGGETLYVGLEYERYSSTEPFENSFWKDYAFVFYDAEGNGISGIPRAEMEDAWEDVALEYRNSERVQVRKITVPENAATMIANLHTQTNSRRMEALRIYRYGYGQPLTTYTSVLSKENNKLYGRTYVAFGDSITHGTGTTTWTSYADYIAAANNMDIYMMAKGGSKVITMYNAMLNNDELLRSLTENDFVTVTGFVNDAKGTTIGELSPVGTTEFDTTTFIGTLEALVYNYISNENYKAKFGIVLTGRPEDYRDRPQYWEAAISVCEKYGIPYLNLYGEEFELADIVHPNLPGQRKMASLIEPWMNTL